MGPFVVQHLGTTSLVEVMSTGVRMTGTRYEKRELAAAAPAAGSRAKSLTWNYYLPSDFKPSCSRCHKVLLFVSPSEVAVI